MSAWTVVARSVDADTGAPPAPALVARVPDGTLVSRARTTWVLRRGWRLPWTRGGGALWTLLLDLEAAGIAAARPAWIARTAFGWMVLARVPTSSARVADALGPERAADPRDPMAGRAAHRERRRIIARIGTLARFAGRAGWPGLRLVTDDLLLSGWPGDRSPLLVGPRIPRARNDETPRVAPTRGLCLSRTDRARLSPRALGRLTEPRA